MDKQINTCIECKSEYFASASKMKQLCPDCAHKLYNYPRCFHKFENGRCTTCYWNGTTSPYLEEKKEKITKKLKRAKTDVTLGIVTICIGAFLSFFTFLGAFGLLVGILFLIRAKKHRNILEKGNL